jgi:threonine dehydratase
MSVRISDHALVRWLERFGGIEMDFFRRHIEGLVADACNAGATAASIDGYIYKIDPNSRSLVTVIGPEEIGAKKARSAEKRQLDETSFKTSKTAADSISAGTIRLWVLAHIKRYPKKGATCDEVEVALGMRHQTVSARITELMDMGALKIIGTRETRSGRPARVYIALENKQ